MLTNRIARVGVAVVLSLSASGVVSPPAMATSTYKEGLTAIRITETFPASWDVANRMLPQILIVNDAVLLPDPTLYRTAQFLPKMITGPVSIEQRVAAGKLLKDAGMLGEVFDVGGSAGPFAPGSSTTVIEFTVSGIDRRILAPALNASVAERPKLTRKQQSNRTRLSAVIDTLTSTSRWKVKSTSVFRPTQYSAWGTKLSLSPTGSVASTFDLSSFTDEAPTCIPVPAKLAEAMPPATQPWLTWRGGNYNVAMRPELPGERVCADESKPVLR
jgi:hypothetical protein